MSAKTPDQTIQEAATSFQDLLVLTQKYQRIIEGYRRYLQEPYLHETEHHPILVTDQAYYLASELKACLPSDEVDELSKLGVQI